MSDKPQNSGMIMQVIAGIMPVLNGMIGPSYEKARREGHMPQVLRHRSWENLWGLLHRLIPEHTRTEAVNELATQILVPEITRGMMLSSMRTLDGAPVQVLVEIENADKFREVMQIFTGLDDYQTHLLPQLQRLAADTQTTVEDQIYQIVCKKLEQQGTPIQLKITLSAENYFVRELRIHELTSILKLTKPEPAQLPEHAG